MTKGVQWKQLYCSGIRSPFLAFPHTHKITFKYYKSNSAGRKFALTLFTRRQYKAVDEVVATPSHTTNFIVIDFLFCGTDFHMHTHVHTHTHRGSIHHTQQDSYFIYNKFRVADGGNIPHTLLRFFFFFFAIAVHHCGGPCLLHSRFLLLLFLLLFICICYLSQPVAVAATAAAMLTFVWSSEKEKRVTIPCTTTH